MKKSVRIYLTGTFPTLFYLPFIKENAEKIGIKGFIRTLEDGRMEIFIEGNLDEVKKMIEICKKGPKHTEVKSVEEKEERFQDFKSFKVLHI